MLPTKRGETQQESDGLGKTRSERFYTKKEGMVTAAFTTAPVPPSVPCLNLMTTIAPGGELHSLRSPAIRWERKKKKRPSEGFVSRAEC